MTEKNFLIKMSDRKPCHCWDELGDCFLTDVICHCRGDINSRPIFCPLIEVNIAKDTGFDGVLWSEVRPDHTSVPLDRED